MTLPALPQLHHPSLDCSFITMTCACFGQGLMEPRLALATMPRISFNFISSCPYHLNAEMTVVYYHTTPSLWCVLNWASWKLDMSYPCPLPCPLHFWFLYSDLWLLLQPCRLHSSPSWGANLFLLWGVFILEIPSAKTFTTPCGCTWMLPSCSSPRIPGFSCSLPVSLQRVFFFPPELWARQLFTV